MPKLKPGDFGRWRVAGVALGSPRGYPGQTPGRPRGYPGSMA